MGNIFSDFFYLQQGSPTPKIETIRGPTPEWVGWTVTGPSPAEGRLPWPGVLLVGELAQVPHCPEGWLSEWLSPLSPLHLIPGYQVGSTYIATRP